MKYRELSLLRTGRGFRREVIEMDTEKEVLNAIISYRNENGEVTDTLKMTREEYDQIISRFSNSHRTVKKLTPLDERIEKAKTVSYSGEVLKLERFGCVDSEGFVKALFLINAWSERIINMMHEHKSFRFVVDYDDEALKTDYYFLTHNEGTE